MSQAARSLSLVSRLSLLVCCLAAAASCNRPGCDQEDYKPSANAPVITNMEYLYALPSDPWMLVFGVEFADPAGDVGNGNALIYLNGNTDPTVLALSDYFESSNVPPDATSGRFAVHLRFASTGVPDGTLVRLGTQLQDASSGLKSNCYSIDLMFNVSSNPNYHSLMDRLNGPRRLAARAWDLLKTAT